MDNLSGREDDPPIACVTLPIGDVSSPQRDTRAIGSQYPAVAGQALQHKKNIDSHI